MYSLTNLYNDLVQFSRALDKHYNSVTAYLEFDDKYLDENYTKTLKKRLLNTRISTLLRKLITLNNQAKTYTIDSQLEMYDYFNSFAIDVVNRSGGILYHIPLTVKHLKRNPDGIEDYMIGVRRQQIKMIRNVRKT